MQRATCRTGSAWFGLKGSVRCLRSSERCHLAVSSAKTQELRTSVLSTDDVRAAFGDDEAGVNRSEQRILVWMRLPRQQNAPAACRCKFLSAGCGIIRRSSRHCLASAATHVESRLVNRSAQQQRGVSLVAEQRGVEKWKAAGSSTAELSSREEKPPAGVPLVLKLEPSSCR